MDEPWITDDLIAAVESGNSLVMPRFGSSNYSGRVQPYTADELRAMKAAQDAMSLPPADGSEQ